MPRTRGSKNRRTVERERAEKIAAGYAELAKDAPPIDFAAPLDSLDIMEHVAQHFYRSALIEERMGADSDWNAIDILKRKALAVAKKVAKYRHAQIASVRLSGDINAKVDDSTIEELLVKIKEEYTKLAPLLELDVVGEAQGSRTEHRLAAGSRAVEHPGA